MIEPVNQTEQVEIKQEPAIIDPIPHFMPNWTKHVLQTGKIHEDIEFTDGSKCLIGEAHGWDINYDKEIEIMKFKIFRIQRKKECTFCEYLSYGYYRELHEGKTAVEFIHGAVDPQEFVNWKLRLYNHMQQYHPKKFKELGY